MSILLIAALGACTPKSAGDSGLVTADTGRALSLESGDPETGDTGDTAGLVGETGPAAPAPPVCAWSEDSLQWVDAPLESPQAQQLLVSNLCEGDCESLSVVVTLALDDPAAGFTLDTEQPDGGWMIAPGGSEILQVSFTAGDYADHAGAVILSTSDEARAEVTIALSGAAAADQDGDGYDALGMDGAVSDCDDASVEVYPGAPELWDGLDQDCDAAVDEGGIAGLASGVVDGQSGQSLGFLGELGAADFDGDGLPEVVLGVESGAAYVLPGDGALGWSGDVQYAAGADYQDSRSYYRLGSVSPSMGDLTGDGLPDLVVGGYVEGSGRVLAVVLEHPSGALDDSDAVLELSGDTTWPQGAEVFSGLDMDGDGISEIAVGDPLESEGDYFRGAAWLVDPYGRSGAVALADADLVVHGALGEYLGSSLGGGDLDGDGYDELLIGAPGATYNDPGSGAFYAVAGGGVPAYAGAVEGAASQIFAGGSEDEAVGFGARPVVADFSGDGAPDLAVAAPDLAAGHGAVYLFTDAGALGGLSDPFSVGVSTIDGAGAPAWFGLGLAAGDLDGDGMADLLVGAPDSLEGSAWGGAGSDLATDEPGALYLFDGATLVSARTLADAARTLAGESLYDLFAQSVLAADLDGDGRGDVTVDAPGWDGDLGYGHDGRVYFLPGR